MVILSKSATVWEGVKASLGVCDIRASSKVRVECIPLGGTKIDVSRGVKHFDEDQRMSWRKVLDLVEMKVS